MSVSVVIPVRDGERFLAAAIESVLAQTVAPGEVIVVDNGSQDASAQIAARYPVRCIGHPHGGAPAARNRGLRAAAGDAVAFVDADDLWTPDKLERQLPLVGQGLVFGHVAEFADPSARAPAAPRPPQAARLFGTLLASRAALEALGPLDETCVAGDLLDWLLRARDAGLREAMVEHVVLHRRLHDRNLTRLRRDALADVPRRLAADLRRRRSAGA